jgi:PAS domain S-box-containing protein
MTRLCGMALLLLLSAVPLVGTEKSRVLVLHSYHHGYQWDDDLTQGFTRTLRDAMQPVDIIHEYLHTKRNQEQHDALLSALLSKRYENRPIDAVVAFDDSALDFFFTHGRDIFTHQPLFFAGANNFNPERLNGLTRMTGVSEVVDIRANIDLIRSLHPQTREILLILDQTHTADRLLATLRPEIEALQAPINIRLSKPRTAQALTKHLRQLKPDTVVLYGFFSRDSEERFFEYDEAAKLIVEASAVPVYSLWDFSLGSGAVGGWVLSGDTHGEAVARQVLQYLQGRAVEKIPLQLAPITTPVFDWEALSRHDINPAHLPENARFINRPSRFYEEYQTVAAVFLVTLSALLIALGALLYRTIRTSAKTRDQARLLNQIAQNTDTVFWVQSADRIIYVSPAYEKLWGRSCQSLYDNPESLLAAIDDQKEVLQHLRHTPENYCKSHRIIRPDGTLRWVQIRMSAVRNSQIAAWVGVAEDITSQKESEELLNHFNHELAARIKEEKTRFEKLQQEKDRQQLLFTQQSKNAALGEVIANIAHQWRQPINILAAQLYNIRRSHTQGKLDGPLMRSYYSEARAIIDQMSRTIDDFRDLFRAESDRLECFCVDDEIAKVIRIYAPLLEKEQIDIHPPATSPECHIFGRRVDFVQLLVELISYAKKRLLDDTAAPTREMRFGLQATEDGCLIGLHCDTRSFKTTAYESDLTLQAVYLHLGQLGGQLEIQQDRKGSHFYLTIPSRTDQKEEGIV